MCLNSKHFKGEKLLEVPLFWFISSTICIKNGIGINHVQEHKESFSNRPNGIHNNNNNKIIYIKHWRTNNKILHKCTERSVARYNAIAYCIPDRNILFEDSS